MVNTITRKWPISLLLLGVLIDHLAYYMVLPILPIMLLTAGLSKVQIGIVLGVIAISFQLGSLIGGYLGDRIQRKRIIAIGALFRAIGLFGFGFFHHYWLFLLSSFICGLGGGMDAPSMKASIAGIVPKEKQTQVFSKRGIAANIGMGVAGLVVFFIPSSSSHIFYVSVGLYILLGLISFFLFPKNCGEKPCSTIPRGEYRDFLHNKPFLWFSVAGVLIWMLYTQLTLVLPLRAATLLPDPKNVSLIWTINSFIVIVFQGMITAYVIRRLHPYSALSLGVLFIGVGISSLYFAEGFLQLAISGIVFIIGEMLIMPTMDSTVTLLTNMKMVGIAFGITNLASGLGEGLGLFIGGKIQELHSPYPWFIYGIGGMLFAFIVLRLKRSRKMRKL